MANKAKSSAVLVMSMADISKLSQTDAVNLFVEKTTAVSRAFMDSAKLIIHIRSTMSKTQTVHGLLGKKGVRTSTINNAMQAVRVWDDLVVRKFVTEAQFDKLSYAAFVDINAAIKAKIASFIGELVAKGDFDEIEFIAENKITRAEHKAKEAPKATTPTKEPEKKPEPAKPAEKPQETTPDGDKVTHLTEPTPEKVTTLEAPAPVVVTVPQPPVTNIVQMPKANPTVEDGEKLIEALEVVFTGLGDADHLRLSAKLVALADLVVERESQIRGAQVAA